MASRVKTFSLCEESYAIVMQKPNKSQHLRTLILQEDDFPRDQLQRINRIHREALAIACHMLWEINERNLVNVLGYLDRDNDDPHFANWNRDGRGVDWFIMQCEAKARLDLP